MTIYAPNWLEDGIREAEDSIGKDKDKSKIKYCACGFQLSVFNRSGNCRACSASKTAEREKAKSGRVCKKCPAGLMPYNTTGYCYKCAVRENIYKRSESGSAKSWRQEQKRNNTTGRIVKCHTPGCRRRFHLESWQHGSMAWCEKCRKGEEYKSFNSIIPVRSRTGFKEVRL